MFNNLTELDEAMHNGELDVVEYVEERNRLLNNLPKWHPEPAHDEAFHTYFSQLMEEADAKIKAEVNR